MDNDQTIPPEVQEFPNSEKVHIQGSRPDIRVPMRKVTLSDSPEQFGGKPNAPLHIYDTSGHFGDANETIDLNRGAPDVRCG